MVLDLVDAAYLEPVMTVEKYWVGGACPWLVPVCELPSELAGLWGLPALLEEFVGTVTQGYTVGDASVGEPKLINYAYSSPERSLAVM